MAKNVGTKTKQDLEDRVTSRMPTNLDAGAVRSPGARGTNTTQPSTRRVTSRVDAQIPAPIADSGASASRFKRGPGETVIPAKKTYSDIAAERMAEVAKRNVGAKIPVSDDVINGRIKAAAKRRLNRRGK